MSISPTLAGSLAAAVAGLSYLNAKFSLLADIKILLSRRAAFMEVAKAANNGRSSLYYSFEEAVKREGDGEALWSREECLSYNQAYTRVHQYAQWFLSQGVKPGDHVVFYMANSPDFMCAWLGLMAIGAAPALINTNLASKPLLHCVGIAQARLIFAGGDDEMLGRLEAVRSELMATGHHIIKLGDVRGQILGMKPVRPADELRRLVEATSPMALAFTSGTTGLSKAIIFPMLAGFLAVTVRKKGYSPISVGGQRGYNCMPYYHLTGGLSALSALAVGDALCVGTKFSSRNFWSDIRDSRATYFVYVGETLRYLMAQPASPLDKYHNVHTIWGNGLRADVWIPFRERFGIDTIYEFYNSTEMMFGLSNACRGDFLAKALGLHGALLRWASRGWHIAVAVDAETGDLLRDPATGFAKTVPFEEGGEILVKLEPGSKLPGRDFRGYWHNEEATSKKIARDVLKKGDCYYRTGDALRRDHEGRWFFCDRLGDTFRWKGENVSTTEVGDALGDFPGIVEANVYGVQLPGHDGRAGAVALYLGEEEKGRFDFAEFLRHCRSRLPRYAVPIFIRLTRAAYSTGTHKQNKVPLKSEGVDPDKLSNDDAIYWIEPSGKDDTYVPFTRSDWESLQTHRARL
ncbi:hypothetical protein M406DRAFT_70283 [Cryphonectria parasitica EP155]|uniref:AMP-dependent synthetase/ligase domain-containing protein n=1 Tax=Cryphonectria parasitica (strain ATCC 38755 / EP155) TaxID=660469 RepID=A0A9P4Y2C9_CRYP1|nr:uncharacterized protein M406DRAFT_70283 [Cryphonectria parasitica EP155]KAF3765224.1 hypothetical protein M406DRAFT_70283 [Cryphonectria parasitica EP155]